MNHPKSIFTDPGSFNGKRQQQPSLTRAPSPSRQTSSPEYPATLTSASRPRPSAPRKTHSPTHPRSSAHKASPNNVSSAVVPSVEREGEAASDTGVLRERAVSQPQTSAPNRTSPYQARDLANTRHFKVRARNMQSSRSLVHISDTCRRHRPAPAGSARPKKIRRKRHCRPLNLCRKGHASSRSADISLISSASLDPPSTLLSHPLRCSLAIPRSTSVHSYQPAFPAQKLPPGC